AFHVTGVQTCALPILTWPSSSLSTMTPKCSPAARTRSSHATRFFSTGGSPCAPRFGSNARYIASSASRSSAVRRRTMNDRPSRSIMAAGSVTTSEAETPAADERQAPATYRIERGLVHGLRIDRWLRALERVHRIDECHRD